ncbi:conserved hypothetical protein [Methylocella tundrae]|uniref:Zinc-finger protein n=1 Tax=Methylocella tundrae TaxID=227605 RepID=A0A8B6M604_METTU|nr:DUF983 domain-containing protein [Methylocella tundrae]VTZ49783.1 conserved hypothetical protein [Methylocella tundrae]
MPTPALDAPAFAPQAAEQEKRDVWLSIRRGLAGHCPACGKGRIFGRYLKVNAVCPHCGEELHHHRADDAPPYATIFIVGHIIGTLMLLTEEFWPDAPIWLHAMIWPTLTAMLSLWFLPRVKGGLIAHQWALRMHGFETAASPRPPKPAV